MRPDATDHLKKGHSEGSASDGPSATPSPEVGSKVVQRWIPQAHGMIVRAAQLLAATATLVLLLAIAWLFSYDRIFEFLGRTQALHLTVSGAPLHWPVGGPATRCSGPTGQRIPGDAGRRSVLEIPPGVTVRITPQRLMASAQERHYWRLEFGAAESAIEKPKVLRELHSSGAAASAEYSLPYSVCVDTASVGTGLVLMVRGRLALGEVAGELDDALPLLEGDLSLIEAPHARRWHALFDYQFESARTNLSLGDRLVMPDSACEPEGRSVPVAGTVPTQATRQDNSFNKVWGLVRLERGDANQALPMTVRAHSWAGGVCLLRGNRPTGHFAGSLLHSLLGDKVLSWLLSMALVLWGVSWSLVRWSWEARRQST